MPSVWAESDPRIPRLEGKRFGRLVAIRRVTDQFPRARRWECECDCGRVVLVQSGNLQNGHSRSCGCATLGQRTTHRAKTKEQAIELFWAKVRKTADCWEWTGSLNAQGYGNFRSRFFRGDILAHRVSWIIARGPIQGGLGVLHRCDTPICVRPEHLFLGTQADNMADCAAKGRHPRNVEDYLPRGINHHLGQVGWKITRKQAMAIRRSTKPQTELARKYGVDPSMISRIKTGVCWRDHPSPPRRSRGAP